MSRADDDVFDMCTVVPLDSDGDATRTTHSNACLTDAQTDGKGRASLVSEGAAHSTSAPKKRRSSSSPEFVRPNAKVPKQKSNRQDTGHCNVRQPASKSNLGCSQSTVQSNDCTTLATLPQQMLSKQTKMQPEATETSPRSTVRLKKISRMEAPKTTHVRRTASKLTMTGTGTMQSAAVTRSMTSEDSSNRKSGSIEHRDVQSDATMHTDIVPEASKRTHSEHRRKTARKDRRRTTCHVQRKTMQSDPQTRDRCPLNNADNDIVSPAGVSAEATSAAETEQPSSQAGTVASTMLSEEPKVMQLRHKRCDPRSSQNILTKHTLRASIQSSNPKKAVKSARQRKRSPLQLDTSQGRERQQKVNLKQDALLRPQLSGEKRGGVAQPCSDKTPAIASVVTKNSIRNVKGRADQPAGAKTNGCSKLGSLGGEVVDAATSRTRRIPTFGEQKTDDASMPFTTTQNRVPPPRHVRFALVGIRSCGCR